MSQPTYVKSAKRKWKTLKKTIERFYRQHGRQMTMAELRNVLTGGH